MFQRLRINESKSLKIYDNDNSSNFAIESEKYEITPNATYTATIDCYIVSGSTQFQIRYYKEDGSIITPIAVDNANYNTAPVNEWSKLTVTATAPESANYLSIVLVTGKGARGTSYWDNLVIDGKAQETPEDPEDPEDPTDPTDPEDPAEDAFEQLQNPGFEEPLNEGQIPHWTLIMGSNQPVLDDTAKYEGNYSIKIEDDSNSDVVGVISDYVKITKGMQVTAKAMVAGNSTGNAELYLRFFDENNQMISQANTVIAAPSEEWQEATVSAIAPENAVKAAVLLYSSKANRGVYNFDKVELTEEEPPEQPEVNLHLSNGSFEKPAETDPSSGKLVIPGWNLKAGDVTISNAMAAHGEKSLYLKNVKDEGSGINLESELIDVEEGQTYSFSANVFIEQRSIQGFYLYVYDEAGNIVKSSDGKDFHAYISVSEPAGEWTFVQHYFTVQPGGKKLKIALIYGNRYTYSFYIDDISVLKAVNNGDFEQELEEGEEPKEGVVPGWRKFAEATDGNTFGITTEKYASGSKSLYIKNDPGKYMNVISDLIDVQPGETYTALARTYIDAGSTGMYVRFFDEYDNYLGQQAWSIRSDITNSWFTNSVKFTVPENASKVGIMFAGSYNKTYLYYIDDVELLKGDHEVTEEPIPENSIVNVGEDLGVQIRKATIMRGASGKDSNGRDVIYCVVAGSPAVFTIIDVETEKVTKSIPLENASGAWAVDVASDGSVYLGAYNLGLLFRYIPETDKLINIGHPLVTKDSVLYPMAQGKDGKMYGSTYPTATLYEYDPATNKITDYGTMSSKTSGERWGRDVEYDAENHKAYISIGNQAQLIEYDFATGTKRDILPAEFNNIISVYDMNLIDGKLFCKKEANNANEMFVLDVKTGEVIEITNGDTGEKTFVVPNFSRGVSMKSPVDNKVYFAAAGGELYSYDLDTNTVKSTGVKIDGAAISYGFVELNEEGFPGYSLVGLSGNNGKMYKYNLETGNVSLTDIMVQAEPVNIHDIEKGPDGKIYTSGYLQGNLGVYVPSTGESYYLSGISQIEGMAPIHNKMYFGVYPDARIYEYDLSKPWNRDNSEKLNPDMLFSLKENNDIPGYTLQDRPFGIAGAEDMNKLFVGTVPKNGLLGGVLAIYDLETREEPKIYWNIVENQSIIDFAYKDGMLYGGTSIHGGQGGSPTAKEAVLFVWDVEKEEKVFEIVPVAGKTSITTLHVGPDGNIWGLANGALFIFDPETREVVYSKDEFPNASGRWIDGSMETGTDGNVYGTVDGKFFKVDAETKEVTIIATQARKLAQDDFGNFYIYTLPEGPNLYKYSDPNLVLKLVGAELALSSTDIKAGEAVTAELVGLLEKGRSTRELSGAQIEFTISDESVVELDNNNNFVAKKEGTATVYATITLDGVTVETNSITITVTDEGTGGSTPEDPEEPQDPEDPEDPEEPQDPEDPEEPEDPQDPEEPQDPQDPQQPGDPQEPTPGENDDEEDDEEDPSENQDDVEFIIDDSGNVVAEDGNQDEDVTKAKLPVEAIDEAISKGINRINVSNSMAAISIDLEALKAALKEGAKEIEITIQEADKETLPASVVEKVGDNPVYNFDIYADGEKAGIFNDKNAIKITIPYELKEGEDPNKIVVYYINEENGNLEVVKNCRYDIESETVTFEIKHLSLYVVQQAVVSFKDVHEDKWSKPYIDALAAREIILGKSAEKFDPEGNTTRAEFITLIMRTLGLLNNHAETDFDDVEKGQWYYDAVSSAKNLGIVNGIGNNLFGVNIDITRQEMAVMLYNAIQAANIELTYDETNTTRFNDFEDIADYAKEAVEMLQKAGILEGIGNNNFVPTRNATREEAAKLIYILLQLV